MLSNIWAHEMCSTFQYLTLICIQIQYGKDYEFDAPVKLLDKHLHAMAQSADEQIVVVSQVFSLFHLPNSACLLFQIIASFCEFELNSFVFENFH